MPDKIIVQEMFGERDGNHIDVAYGVGKHIVTGSISVASLRPLKTLKSLLARYYSVTSKGYSVAKHPNIIDKLVFDSVYEALIVDALKQIIDYRCVPGINSNEYFLAANNYTDALEISEQLSRGLITDDLLYRYQYRNYRKPFTETEEFSQFKEQTGTFIEPSELDGKKHLFHKVHFGKKEFFGASFKL